MRTLAVGSAALVLVLVLVLDSRAQDAPPAPPAEACVACHERLTPALVADWRASPHAAKEVGCKECHGGDHSTIFGRRGRVSAKACARCHPKAGEEFAPSGHARALDALAGDPRFLGESEAGKRACLGCHGVGERDAFDGSRGRCSACHFGHGATTALARDNGTCAVCHSGPGQPQWEAYAASRHGVLFALAPAPARAPTCASCHMPGGSHARDDAIALGGILDGARIAGDPSHPAPPFPQPAISREAFERARAAMVERCAPCHGRRFASVALEEADEVKREADRLLAGAARAAAAGGALERRFGRLRREDAGAAWKGAYHQAPRLASAEGLDRLRAGCRDLLDATPAPAAPDRPSR